MDQMTRALLRELLDTLDAATEGDSDGAEIAAGYELMEQVRALVGATPPTGEGKGSVHADALREVVDMAERNDVTTPQQDAALRWAVTVAERPPLSPTVVGALNLIWQAGQKGYGVRRLGDDGHVVAGTARHLVKGPDDFSFPREDTDVRDTYLRVTLTSGVDVAWLVSDLAGDYFTGTFVL